MLVRPFPTLSWFSIFSQIILELIFAIQNKKKMYWNNQRFCWQTARKVLRILCTWTLKILYSNNRILTQQKCLPELGISKYLLYYSKFKNNRVAMCIFKGFTGWNKSLKNDNILSKTIKSKWYRGRFHHVREIILVFWLNWNWRYIMGKL